MSLTAEDLKILTKPFSSEKLGVKVQSLSKDKTRAMLVVYLDHATVAERLDQVDPNWSFSVKESSRDGDLFLVHGILAIKGIVRENCGEGDSVKEGFSDALKRCAMSFGVGRSLYSQEQVWVPYNEATDRYKQYSYADYEKYLKKVNPPAQVVAQSQPQTKPRQSTKPQDDPNSFQTSPTHIRPVSHIPVSSQDPSFTGDPEPVQARRDRLMSYAKKADTSFHKWTIPLIQNYMKLKYGKELAADLSNAQFEEFCHTIENSSFSEAIKLVSMPKQEKLV